MIRFLAMIIGCVIGAGAAAQNADPDYTAESMLELCNGNARDIAPELQSYICTFRIQGVADTMRLNCQSIEYGAAPLPVMSVGPIPSRGAARQAFVNYMQAHPEEWGYSWSVVLVHALSDTFPCDPSE